MGRAVLKALKQSTLLTFWDICGKWGFKPKRDYNYNSIDGSIKWSNGSTVHLKDLQQMPSDPEYDSLGSTEYTGAFIDEASQIKQKAKNIVMSRIRYKLIQFNLVPKLLITSNPSKNFLYKEFYRPWKDKKLEDYRVFIPSLVQDNPFMPSHYIRNLQKLDPISKQRLLYGNFDYDDDPAKLFEYDDILDLYTNTPKNREGRYLTCDVARKGKDKTTIFYWEGLLVRGIWAYPVTLIDDTVRLLDEKCQKLHVKRSHCIVDEDGVGGGVVDIFKGCRGFVNNSTPIPHGPEKTNYTNLKSQCYFHLAGLAKTGEVGVRTSNDSYKEALTEELEQIKQKDVDKDGKLAVMGKDYIRDNIGRSPDFSDALMMRMLLEVAPRRISIMQDKDNVTGLY